jgi:L-serine dehydratase
MVDAVLAKIAAYRRLHLDGPHSIPFDPASDIIWLKIPHAVHPNAVRFTALDGPSVLARRLYFSVGGGFVVDESELLGTASVATEETRVPYAFTSAAQLLAQTEAAGLTIAELMRENERAFRTDAEIDAGLDHIWTRMDACVRRGLLQEGTLPGGLRVPCRARRIYEALRANPEALIVDPLATMDFVNVWALAVNEENANGGRW